MRSALARISAWAVEHPAQTVAVAVLLTLIGTVAALLRLGADRSPYSLVDTGSTTYRQTQQFYEQFGDEPVVILVREDLGHLLLTDDLGRLLGLESCLSGNAPNGQIDPGKPAPPGCAELAQLHPAKVVFGPATFLNQLAIQAQKLYQQQAQAAIRQARQAAAAAVARARRYGESPAVQKADAAAAAQGVMTQFQQQIIRIGTRYGQTSPPNIANPTYVESVMFDPTQPGHVPKAKYSYLVPSSNAALVTIRLRPDLTGSEREQAISLFREVLGDKDFHLQGGGSYVVSGVPVVFDGLAHELSTQIFVLLAVALAAMTIALAVVFRPPLRLLPLAMAVGAVALVFGFLGLVGGSLSMASIAVLPVLIGLGVDYAIQLQARFNEQTEAGASRPRAAVEAASIGGPVIATAGLATAAGFAVLVLSPIPQVRDFAWLLVVGIVVAFCLALTVGLAALSLTGRGGVGRSRAGVADRTQTRLKALRSSSAGRLSPATSRLRGLRDSVGARAGSVGRRALAASIRAPARVLAAGAFLAILGWAAGSQIDVVSDIRQLVPSSLPELQDVDQLEQETGISGLAYVTVNAPDITDPKVVDWMGSFEQGVLGRHGFAGESASCQSAHTELCPNVAFPDLFPPESGPVTHGEIATILRVLPSYVSQAFVQQGHGDVPDTSVITFGIKVMPFDQQKQLIDDIRAQLDPPGSTDDPPDGVDAQVVGLSVLAADANSSLESNRYLVTIVGLIAVAIVLLALYRSVGRAFVPLIPIAFATGWSSLVLWASGVPLNPMSATLGALVIAIATEFSVILSARYYEERGLGASPGEALRRAYARTGVAIAASGTTAIVGFAVLIASDIRMLRDFGLVTVLDLAVALCGVLLVLPAALVWAERRFPRLVAVRDRLRRRRPAPDVA